jgi:nitroreductase
MDTIETLFTRRSIRKYTGVPVSDEDSHTILRAGFYAPSAKNRQPWHFIVVRSLETRSFITTIQPYTKMLPQADCCIIVCGDNLKERKTGFLVEDCSAALENMLLAAHGLGLGAVWCGIYPLPEVTKAISEYFSLPDNIIPIGLISIGHKGEDRTTEERFQPDLVHFEKW